MKLKKKLRMFKEFGFWVGLSSFCSSAFRFPMAITRWKDRCIVRWLKHKFSHIIAKHKQSPADLAKNDGTIWTLWWQGKDNAPEVVKMCFDSMNRHKGNHRLVILSKDNLGEYITLPEHIIRKADEGIITLTHLSDIIRFYLLAHYGGMWIDSTIFVNAPISESIFTDEYYIIRHEENHRSYGVNRDRWISFLQAGRKGNTLCRFGYDLLAEYWKHQDMLIDYMLIDYAIEIAYEEFPECRRMLDSVELNNSRIDDLRPIMNEEWDEERFRELSRETQFFKLTYKHRLVKEINGRETFYGHLLTL